MFKIYIYLFLLFICLTGVSQKRDVFEHISTNEGLSQDAIEVIVEDDRGFLWFGTEYGLNRYDGKSFKIFVRESNKLNTLSNIYIYSLCCTHDGNIWIGTREGLNKYNPLVDSFEVFRENRNEKHSLAGNQVYSVYECENEGNWELWIGTNAGLCRYLPEKNFFINYITDKKDNSGSDRQRVKCLLNDSENKLWVGTDKGLFIFNREDKVFKPIGGNFTSVNTIFEVDEEIWVGTSNGLFILNLGGEKIKSCFHDEFDVNSLSDNNITSICEDLNGDIWVGTHNGLNYVQNSSVRSDTLLQFLHYFNKEGNKASLSNNYVNAIYCDKSGVLWIGTYGSGLNKLNVQKKKFTSNNPKGEVYNRLGNSNVLSVFQDNDSILWVGTHGGGLHRIDRKTDVIKQYKHDIPNKWGIPHNYIRSIKEDKFGFLWMTSDGGGLIRMDKKTEKFYNYVHEEGENSLAYNVLRYLYIDENNEYWICTFGGGLDRMNYFPDNDSLFFRNYSYDPGDTTTISSNVIYTLYEDSERNIWVGADGGGLNKLNRETGEFKRYSSIPDNTQTLISNFITSICLDNSGWLWVGTDAGLDKLNIRTEEISHVSQDYNFYQIVYSLLFDANNNAWLSTNKGIWRFDPDNNSFYNYTINDGLRSNEFWGNSFYKTSGGEMFFGGVNGIDFFHPKNIKVSYDEYPLLFTSLKLYGEEVKVGKDYNDYKVLNKAVFAADEIHLSYMDNVFGFEFAVLQYLSPKHIRYAYLMEGLNNDWINNGTVNYVSFNGLSPGTYVLKVKATNSDGVWMAKMAKIKVIIHPPFWQTKWFKLLLISVIAFLVFFFVELRIRVIKKQKNQLQKLVKERTKVIEQQKEELISINEDLEMQRASLLQAYDNIKLLSKIGQEITSTLSIAEIAKRNYSYIKSIMSVDEFGIGIYRAGTDELVFSNYYYMDKKMEEKKIHLSDKGNPAVFSFLHKKEIIIQDIQEEYNLYFEGRNISPDYDFFSSAICLPIISGKESIGVLCLFSKKKSAFNSSHCDMVRNICVYVTIAIHNAKSYQKIKEQTSKLNKANHQLRDQKTELENSKEKIELVNKNLNDFAYIVSHDLKAPLRGIAQLSVWLCKDYAHSIDEEGKRILNLMRDRVENMEALVNGVLEYSRVGTDNGEKEIFDVKEAVNDVVEILSVPESIKVSIDLCLPKICAHRLQFKQVIQNLMSNSIKYMDKIEGRIWISHKEDENYWCFTVKDNGPGISKKYHEKIFKMFQTLETKSHRKDSTGVGLAIVKKIVEKHNGKIWVDSEEGRGTSVSFSVRKGG